MKEERIQNVRVLLDSELKLPHILRRISTDFHITVFMQNNVSLVRCSKIMNWSSCKNFSGILRYSVSEVKSIKYFRWNFSYFINKLYYYVYNKSKVLNFSTFCAARTLNCKTQKK